MEKFKIEHVPGIGSSPNQVLATSDKFYISYNAIDSGWYGSDTTAIVIGQMQAFYILNGDHRKEFEKLEPLGLDACMEYYHNNKQLHNKYTDTPEKLKYLKDLMEKRKETNEHNKLSS